MTTNNNYKEYTVKVYRNGSKAWWLNDKRHHEDGPAIEWADGSKEWYLNGKLHHEDGPAVEWTNGYKEWWLNGKEYTEEQWKKEIAKIKNKNSCNGRIVEIDGKKYKLIETN